MRSFLTLTLPLSEGIGQLVNLDEGSMKGILEHCKRFESIPSTLFDHPYFGTVTKLDLSGWRMTEGIGKLVHLEELNLQDCRQLLELPAGFGGLKSLKVLNLSSSSPFIPMSLQSLPKGFGNLTALASLILHGCPAKLPAALEEQLKAQVVSYDTDDCVTSMIVGRVGGITS